MKKRIFIIVLLIFPVLINASTFNNAIDIANKYYKNFDSYESYLRTDENSSIYNFTGGESKKIDGFLTGGFLSEQEYNISNRNGVSYLSPGAEYWLINGKKLNLSIVDSTPKQGSSGVRVTEFTKYNVEVSGTGTYSNPWVFNSEYKVTATSAHPGKGTIVKGYEEQYSGSSGSLDIKYETINGYGFKKIVCDGGQTSKISDGLIKINQINQNINCTLYFDANTYFIKYNANGGTGTMANSTHTYDSVKELSANEFTKPQYKFTAWNTKADGTGTKYANKESIINLTNNNGEIINLYAMWEIDYIISYAGHVYSTKNDPCKIPKIKIEDKIANVENTHMNSCGMVVPANRESHPPADYTGFGILTPWQGKWGIYANEPNVYYTLNNPTDDITKMTPLSVYEWKRKEKKDMYIYIITPVQTPDGYDFIGEVHTITTNINHGNWSQWSSGIMVIDNIKNKKDVQWGCYIIRPLVKGIEYTGFGVMLTGGKLSYDSSCGLGNYKIYSLEDNIYYSSKATNDESDLILLNDLTWEGNANKKYYIYKKK